MPQGLVNPENSILVAGEPIIQEMEVKTATTMYPGRLVIKDTTDYQIKVCTTGATTCIGVLDIEPGQLYTTLYDAGDQARVLRGDIVVELTYQGGGPTPPVLGDRLIPAADGMVQKGTTAGAVIGYSLQSLTYSASSQPILVKLLI